MSSDPLYALKQFHRAVEVLVTSPGDVRSRLLLAFEELVPIRPADLPEHLKPEFEWIKERLTRRQPEWYERNLGRLGVTLKWMKNKTGVKIAQKIYDVQLRLEDHVNSINGRN